MQLSDYLYDLEAAIDVIFIFDICKYHWFTNKFSISTQVSTVKGYLLWIEKKS